MSTLTKCLKKMGKILSSNDIEMISAERESNLAKGMNEQTAESMAIESAIRIAEQSVNEYETEIEARGGKVLDKINLDRAIAEARNEYNLPSPESRVDAFLAKNKIGDLASLKNFEEDLILESRTEDFTPEEQRVIKHGGFGKSDSNISAIDKVPEMLTGFREKAVQRVFDPYYSIKELAGDETAWKLMHISASAPDAVEGMLKAGQLFLTKEGLLNVDMTKKSMYEILEPLGDDLNRWTYWMAGNRADILKGKGKENLFNKDQIEVLKNMNKGNEELFNKVREEFEELNNSVVQIGVDTGLISKEEADIWREEGFYLPFYRVLDEEKTSGPRVSKNMGFVRQQAYKKLKGGTSKLDDLLTNSVLNWNHILSASLRNQAAVKAIKSAAEAGLATKISESEKTKDSVYVRVNGKEVWFTMEPGAELIAESLNSMYWEGLNSLPMRFMRKMKRVFTMATTANPEFQIRNLIKDTIQAVAATTVSTNIGTNLMDGWAATKKNTNLEWNMRVSGATFGHSGFVYGDTTEALHHLMQQGLTKKEAESSIINTKDKVVELFRKYQDFGSRLENINRAADYVQTLERTGSQLEAVFASRDHIDFTRVGSSRIVRFIAAVSPFINAHLQGINKLARSAPGLSLKEIMDPKVATRFKSVVGLYTMASVAMYLMMRNDDDYKETPEWEKRTYHLFKVPGVDKMFRIPRPFEIGAIGYMGESFARALIGDDVHGELFAERLANTVWNTMGMNPIPQLLMPALEIGFNMNTFTGNSVEPEYMHISDLPAVDRRKAWTSETAILLSEGLSKIPWDSVQLSPIQVQHLVNGYLGWAGSMGLAGLDMAMSRPLTDAPERPTKRLFEYPVMKTLVKELPAHSSQYVSDFYKDLTELNSMYASIQASRERGELEDYYNKVVEAGDKIAFRKLYNKRATQLRKINKRIRIILASSMSPDEKRDNIDRLELLKKEIAKQMQNLYRTRNKD